MIVKDTRIDYVPKCGEVRVFENHIEIPIEIDKEHHKYLSELFDIRKGAGFNANLLIPLDNNMADVNNVSFLHILDSCLKRTDSYNDRLDNLFANSDWFEIKSFAEPCKLSVIERINLLSSFIPKAN